MRESLIIALLSLTLYNCNENSIKSEIEDAPCVIILPESKTVLLGRTYKAQIILTCYKPDSAQKISIDTNLPGEGTFNQGKIYYEYRPAKAGVNLFKGEVIITNENGEEVIYPFEDEFNCVLPSTVISVNNLHYLIKGEENLITISHQGFLSNQLVVTASNATIKKAKYHNSISPGSYLVTPNDATPVNIEVWLKTNYDTIKLSTSKYEVINKFVVN